MNIYTEILKSETKKLCLDDEDYEERLREAASLFRGFDEALTTFIAENGYTGDAADVSAKAKFLQKRFEAANIEPAQRFKDWFVPNKWIKRDTAFKICFALGLNVEQTNDFFKRVQFERSFDCHSKEEAVYYFCMKNGLSYLEAREMIAHIPAIQKVKMISNDGEVLYTGTIMEYINSIKDKEQLIRYIKDNINDFQYNNVTAIKYIQKLWEKISMKGGLAEQEGIIIDRTYNRYEDRSKKGDTDSRKKEIIEAEVYYQEKVVKPEDLVVVKEKKGINKDATWTIFSQIIGLTNYNSNKYYMKNRSISHVLSENKLLPLKANSCFPSRQNIDHLVRGGVVSDHETIRKMLIFLLFYTHWAEIVVREDDAFYLVQDSDRERCYDRINTYLLDAGYQELYEGNPYDWIFMIALNDDYPLFAFRYYMGEVFVEKEEDDNG